MSSPDLNAAERLELKQLRERMAAVEGVLLRTGDEHQHPAQDILDLLDEKRAVESQRDSAYALANAQGDELVQARTVNAELSAQVAHWRKIAINRNDTAEAILKRLQQVRPLLNTVDAQALRGLDSFMVDVPKLMGINDADRLAAEREEHEQMMRDAGVSF